MALLPFRKRRAAADPSSAKDSGQESAVETGPVNILRYLRAECIRLDLQTQPTPVGEDETETQRERRLVTDKETLCQELTDVLDASGQINNPTKFFKDMVNRERKATTAIAPGIAVPHVRSQQVREFVMGFARARDGFPFASLDGGLTKLFFMLAAPPWDDKLYLKVYREFAEMVQNDWVVDAFLDAENEQDVLNVLRGFVTS